MEFGSELERDKALRAVVDKMLTRVSVAELGPDDATRHADQNMRRFFLPAMLTTYS